MLYLISGCNGAGKTTFSADILLGTFNCKEFLNADKIAEGISPFNPEAAAIPAGKILIDRIEILSRQKIDFGIETTLSGKIYKNVLERCKENGYSVWLIYLWLSSTELAKKRIELRVKKGGHHIQPDVTERRYARGLVNLFDVFMPVCDRWIVFDNSGLQPLAVAEGGADRTAHILHEDIWKEINQHKQELDVLWKGN